MSEDNNSTTPNLPDNSHAAKPASGSFKEAEKISADEKLKVPTKLVPIGAKTPAEDGPVTGKILKPAKKKLAVIGMVMGAIAFVTISCLLFFGFFSLLSLLGVKGSGNVTTEERKLAEFTEIEVKGKGILNITQSRTHDIEISAEDNLIDLIETEVKGDKLVISFKRELPFLLGRKINNSEDIVYNINVRELSKLKVSGSATLNSDEFTAEELEINVSGSADIKFKDLTCEQLLVKSEGSVQVELDGNVQEQEINITGSGKYDALELNTEKTVIKLSGSGNLKVFAEDELEIRISGSGEVSYRGNPKKLRQDISGSGSVNQVTEEE